MFFLSCTLHLFYSSYYYYTLYVRGTFSSLLFVWNALKTSVSKRTFAFCPWWHLRCPRCFGRLWNFRSCDGVVEKMADSGKFFTFMAEMLLPCWMQLVSVFSGTFYTRTFKRNKDIVREHLWNWVHLSIFHGMTATGWSL